jgi:hypothetical protein
MEFAISEPLMLVQLEEAIDAYEQECARAESTRWVMSTHLEREIRGLLFGPQPNPLTSLHGIPVIVDSRLPSNALWIVGVANLV